MTLSRWNVSFSEFVGLFYASSIIVDNWLYIDGGEYHLQGPPNPSGFVLNQTLSINLSSSWTTSEVQINAVNKPSGPINFKYQALWRIPKPSSILAFGGDPYTNDQGPTTIWTLRLDGYGGGTWGQQYNSSDTVWKSLVWPYYGLAAASPTTGYIFGGYYWYGEGFRDIIGITELDFEKSQWNSTTTTSKYSPGIMGVAQFVPLFGEAGIVVLLGGTTPTRVLKPMSVIEIYDPSSRLWYLQTATGDVPRPRTDICIVGAQSTNLSTFEIFIYGGTTDSSIPFNNTDSANVYILTLPAFRWIRVGDSTAPRAGSSCQFVNSQMISVGGWDPTNKGTSNPWTIDPWRYGIGVFDLTSLRWINSFNASARQYVRSGLVNDFYANNALYPALWNNSALGEVFGSNLVNTPTTSPTASPTNDATSPTSTVTSTTTSTSNPLSNPPQISSTPSAAPIGAIVGGVIGGIAFLVAALGALWWWFCLRGRKSQSSMPELGSPSPRASQYMPELGPPRHWEMSANGTGGQIVVEAPNPTIAVTYHEVQA